MMNTIHSFILKLSKLNWTFLIVWIGIMLMAFFFWSWVLSLIF